MFVDKSRGGREVTAWCPVVPTSREQGWRMDRCLCSSTGIDRRGATAFRAGNPEVRPCSGHLCPIPVPERDERLLLSRRMAGMERVACTEGCQPQQVLVPPAASQQVGINEGKGGTVRLPVQLAQGDFLL